MERTLVARLEGFWWFPRIVRIGFAKLVRHILTRRTLIRHLQKRGIKVIVWVLNSPEEWEEAFRLGVDGVMTDYPAQLSEFWENNKNDIRSTI